MSNEISIDYTTVLKAYQSKSSELLTQLITSEARVIASSSIISSLQEKIILLEEQIDKLQKTSTRSKKQQTDAVDYTNT